ncbi:hypothetical protein F5B19DRAFT_63809 [Rostrohypoxylon terebratum]|nr:hypothetical protein F5B19DRAFT_63809 [Rostrohypoxylon terebratum]
MSSPASNRPASIADTEYAVPDAPHTITERQDQPAWDNARFALRIISTTLCLPFLGVGLAGFATPKGFGAYPLLATPLAATVLLYDFTEYVVMCATMRKTGIRPQISLGFELVLSLAGIAISAILISLAFDSYSWHDYYDGRDETPVPKYIANGNLWLGLNVIASFSAVIISLVHFILFVRDCVEVHWYRKNRSAFYTLQKQQESPEKEMGALTNPSFRYDGAVKTGPPVNPSKNRRTSSPLLD